MNKEKIGFIFGMKICFPGKRNEYILIFNFLLIYFTFDICLILCCTQKLNVSQSINIDFLLAYFTFYIPFKLNEISVKCAMSALLVLRATDVDFLTGYSRQSRTARLANYF